MMHLSRAVEALSWLSLNLWCRREFCKENCALCSYLVFEKMAECLFLECNSRRCRWLAGLAIYIHLVRGFLSANFWTFICGPNLVIRLYIYRGENTLGGASKSVLYRIGLKAPKVDALIKRFFLAFENFQIEI